MEIIQKELLTITELAERLKVPRSWLYARTREKGSNNIPMIRVGKYIRFEEEAVIEWLKEKQHAD